MIKTTSFRLGFLKNINGNKPESVELQKKFANPKLTKEELISLMNDFVKYNFLLMFVYRRSYYCSFIVRQKTIHTPQKDGQTALTGCRK